MLIDPPGFEGLAINRIYGSFGTNKADQVWPPYDLQIFAGYCKKEGHQYKILDANNLKLSDVQIANEIKRYSPDWVIYMTCFPTFKLDAKIAKIAKKVDRKITVACMSLSIFSVLDPKKQMEELPDLDFIPWAEPEVPLMSLINGEDPSKVKGLYYRKSGKVLFSGPAEKLKNLDELGVPVHREMPYRIYKCPMAIHLPMAVVTASRGCINRCVHCQAGSFQRAMRYRSVENVLKELEEINSLGIREIKFWDCSLPSNPQFLKNLCEEMIKRKYNFTWHCNARAEFITPSLLKVMKKSGCHTLALGCESANNELLKRMNKNETKEQIESAVMMIKKEKMRTLMYLTFGLEGETKETMKETFNFVMKLRPEFVTFGIVVPAPGTPFYDYVEKKGYLFNKRLEYQDP
ncbi:MAG: radical SAM protein, partial [archaeon]